MRLKIYGLNYMDNILFFKIHVGDTNAHEKERKEEKEQKEGRKTKSPT